MKRFATLLDRLSYQPQRNGKLRLLADYFAHTPDPDRGWALAALTGELRFAEAKPALIRDLAMLRSDPVLFGYSYDYVGDLAETVALIWRGTDTGADLRLHDVVERLRLGRKADLPAQLATWLDAVDATGRWALIKLITGALRVGVSARLARAALAQWSGRDVTEIEEIWHALAPPYGELFAWLEGGAPRPDATGRAAFRPVMLAHPLDEEALGAMDPGDYVAEWKWDGARVQIVGEGGRVRLYARSGDELGPAFPELVEGLQLHGTLDGELLIRAPDGGVGPFAELQKRLNRKTVSNDLLRRAPAFVRLYDMLFDGAEDLRPLPFVARRARLEAWHAAAAVARLDLSSLVPFATWADLAAQRAGTTRPGVEGLMLKRRDAPYVAGRPRGLWWKWKHDPMLVDAVLLYAQRGHGKRSSFYSDFTFGIWRDGELVPVGKAYFGFTDAELGELDRWVRSHTVQRFGPVREVEKKLVLEVAFEGLQRSTRHRSGLAMRFPRISRIRWDKPAAEADTIEALERLLR